MIDVSNNALLTLWNAAGFFRLLSCWVNDELDDYQNYNEFLVGTRPGRKEICRAEDTAGVYVLYFSQNGNFYIGSSWQMAKRTAVHLSMMRNNKHPNSKISKVYDENNGREPSILFINTYTERFAREVEQRLIDLVFSDLYCLNQNPMVEEYRPETITTREKKRSSALRQWSDPIFKEKIRELNQRPESRSRRVATANLTAEDPNYRKKLSDASKKTWQNEKYIANQKLSGAVVWKDAEFRERHRSSMVRYWADPEYKTRVQLGLFRSNENKRRSVTIDGVRYPHAKAAAAELGISETSVRRKGTFDS